MGLNIKDIIEKKQIGFDELQGKILVVDSFNILYQFLTTIRQGDGSYLTDSKGNITSHLTGLFSRTINLMQKGIRLAFVFDGKAPELKKKERQRRKELKKKAQAEYDAARDREDVDGMKKYSARTARLTPEMARDSKELIQALGLPVIEALSEGEAQAAHIVSRGDAYAALSQDYDSLLFGAPYLVHNLTITGRRRVGGKLSYQRVHPELIGLNENLEKLGIDRDQLIIMALLVGTDFNTGGIKGIGQKKALQLVKEHDDPEKIFLEAGWDEHFDFSWKEAYDTIKNMPTSDDYDLTFSEVDEADVMRVLVEKHDFSEERVKSGLRKLSDTKAQRSQTSLGEFI